MSSPCPAGFWSQRRHLVVSVAALARHGVSPGLIALLALACAEAHRQPPVAEAVSSEYAAGDLCSLVGASDGASVIAFRRLSPSRTSCILEVFDRESGRREMLDWSPAFDALYPRIETISSDGSTLYFAHQDPESLEVTYHRLRWRDGIDDTTPLGVWPAWAISGDGSMVVLTDPGLARIRAYDTLASLWREVDGPLPYARPRQISSTGDWLALEASDGVTTDLLIVGLRSDRVRRVTGFPVRLGFGGVPIFVGPSSILVPTESGRAVLDLETDVSVPHGLGGGANLVWSAIDDGGALLTVAGSDWSSPGPGPLSRLYTDLWRNDALIPVYFRSRDGEHIDAGQATLSSDGEWLVFQGVRPGLRAQLFVIPTPL